MIVRGKRKIAYRGWLSRVLRVVQVIVLIFPATKAQVMRSSY